MCVYETWQDQIAREIDRSILAGGSIRNSRMTLDSRDLPAYDVDRSDYAIAWPDRAPAPLQHELALLWHINIYRRQQIVGLNMLVQMNTFQGVAPQLGSRWFGYSSHLSSSVAL